MSSAMLMPIFRTQWKEHARDGVSEIIGDNLLGTNMMQARLSTLEGEAMAIKEAIEEMVQKGFSHARVTQTLVDAICSSHLGISDFSMLISNIKALLVLHPNFEVKFVRRQTNMAAHSLARAAYSISRRRIFESVPYCIHNILINEMN
jgi:hypothetical protein